MKIFLTGDTHIPLDIEKLGSDNFVLGNTLTKKDYVIVLGDFGLLWRNSPNHVERNWTSWLDEKPWTTLFIDGNHDNHYRLGRLKKISMFGGSVGKVSDSIFHLRRAEIYDFDGKSIFTFGGALSIDKLWRTEGLDWWRQELPNSIEMEAGLNILESHKNKVDYILTHTLPQSLVNVVADFQFHAGHPLHDPTCDYLQHIYGTVDFEKGFCGHFHQNRTVEKYTILYEDILRLV